MTLPALTAAARAIVAADWLHVGRHRRGPRRLYVARYTRKPYDCPRYACAGSAEGLLDQLRNQQPREAR